MVHAEGEPKILKSSGRRRRRAKFWLSASNIGRGGSESRGGYPPSSYGARPFWYITGWGDSAPPPPLPSKGRSIYWTPVQTDREWSEVTPAHKLQKK